MDSNLIIKEYSLAKETFYRSLRSFSIYGKGWLARTSAVDATAKTLIG
jgi:lysozyme family protein